MLSTLLSTFLARQGRCERDDKTKKKWRETSLLSADSRYGSAKRPRLFETKNKNETLDGRRRRRWCHGVTRFGGTGNCGNTPPPPTHSQKKTFLTFFSVAENENDRWDDETGRRKRKKERFAARRFSFVFFYLLDPPGRNFEVAEKKKNEKEEEKMPPPKKKNEEERLPTLTT